MKQFIDYIPLLIFFTVWMLDERVINVAGFDYTLGGVFSAAEFPCKRVRMVNQEYYL